MVAPRAARYGLPPFLAWSFGRLYEPLAGPPFVLLEQDAAKLGQCVCADIVERPEDPLAVWQVTRLDDRHVNPAVEDRLAS